MKKFKEGDLVVGNRLASNYYSVTKQGTKWKVLGYEGSKVILASTISSSGRFTVLEKCFDLKEGEDNLLEIARDKYPMGTKVNNHNLGYGCMFIVDTNNFQYSERDKSIDIITMEKGSYTVYKKGNWAEVLEKTEDIKASLPFKKGDKVYISESSGYRSQDLAKKYGEWMLGTVIKINPEDKPFQYRVEWEDDTADSYKTTDLILAKAAPEEEGFKFKEGDNVYINPDSMYREQGMIGDELLLGTVLKVIGEGYPYEVSWKGKGSNVYREKDLQTAELIKDIPERPTRADAYHIDLLDKLSKEIDKLPKEPTTTKETPLKFPDDSLRFRKDEVYLGSVGVYFGGVNPNKSTTELEFQDPVIVKQSTGRKRKLITII